jgi:hypothetical protein
MKYKVNLTRDTYKNLIMKLQSAKRWMRERVLEQIKDKDSKEKILRIINEGILVPYGDNKEKEVIENG